MAISRLRQLTSRSGRPHDLLVLLDRLLAVQYGSNRSERIALENSRARRAARGRVASSLELVNQGRDEADDGEQGDRRCQDHEDQQDGQEAACGSSPRPPATAGRGGPAGGDERLRDLAHADGAAGVGGEPGGDLAQLAVVEQPDLAEALARAPPPLGGVGLELAPQLLGLAVRADPALERRPRGDQGLVGELDPRLSGDRADIDREQSSIGQAAQDRCNSLGIIAGPQRRERFRPAGVGLAFAEMDQPQEHPPRDRLPRLVEGGEAGVGTLGQRHRLRGHGTAG